MVTARVSSSDGDSEEGLVVSGPVCRCAMNGAELEIGVG